MIKSKYENMKMYFPFLAKEAVEFKDDGKFELIVKLKSGEVISYDDLEKTIRNLPGNSDCMTENECRTEFGIRLRNIMFRKGITQAELSSMTGITQTMISKYITGKTSPSFYNVDKIAKALRCSIEELRYTF